MDGQESINKLYKLADDLKFLPRLIVNENGNFISLFNIVDRIKNKNINKIYKYIKNIDQNNNINFLDVIIAYYSLVQNDFMGLKPFLMENMKTEIIDFFMNLHLQWNPNYELLTVITDDKKYDLFDYIVEAIENFDKHIDDLLEDIKTVNDENIVIAYYFYLKSKNSENVLDYIKELGYDNILEIIDNLEYDNYQEWKNSVVNNKSELNDVNEEDIIMSSYESRNNDETIINKIYYESNWLVKKYLSNKYDEWITINNTKFDDSDRIRIHKWRYHQEIKSGIKFPVRFSVVRPRDRADKLNISGTKDLIFESLPEILIGSITQGEQFPSEIYTYIETYGKKIINRRDIVMMYNYLNKTTPERVTFLTGYIKNNQNISELEIVNKFYELMGSVTEKFSTQDDLDVEYKEWLKIYKDAIDEDDEIFNYLIDIHMNLIALDHEYDLIISKPVINSTLQSFSPTINNRLVNIEDGYDIFNKSKISEHVPFICYNDGNGKSLYKILNHRGQSINFSESIGQIYKFILPSTDTSVKDSIYMNIWIGDDQKTVFNSPQKTFYTVIYHIDGNKLTIESKLEGHNTKSIGEKIYQYVRDGLPSLSLGKGVDIKTRFEFNIYNLSVEEMIFSDLILNDVLMKEYLYIDESKMTLTVKKRFDIHYNNLFDYNMNPAASFTLTKKNYLSSEMVDVIKSSKTHDYLNIKDNEVDKLGFNAGTEYLKVNITQSDPQIINVFIHILKLLFYHYTKSDKEIISLYNDYLPETMKINMKSNTIVRKEQLPLIVSGKSYVPKLTENSSKGFGIIKVPSKSLSIGTMGYLRKTIENILGNYSTDEGGRFVRYGTITSSINSFLHCVCYAIDHPDYIKLENEYLKEDYIKKLRIYLSNNIELSLLKQELFDYSDNEITKLFRDESNFFDPFLLYRAVEEIFNINLYVFTYDNDNAIEIPRHKIFHARPARLYRPTILISKTHTKDGDVPKYELIVDYNEEKFEIVKIFGDNMTKICHSLILENYHNLITFSKDNNKYVGRENIYYNIDNVKIFNNVISQYVDEYGKVRALDININGLTITVSVPPCQPENLPIINELKSSHIDNIFKIFGDPEAITLDQNNYVNGLWYKLLDINHGIYIKVIPSNRPDLLRRPVGPNNQLSFTAKNLTSRLRKLKRTVNIIVELVKWCYTLSIKIIQTTPYQFQKDYFKVVERNIDSSEYYDISKIDRKLPEIYSTRTVVDAINYMSVLAPSLFQDGKIIMYNQDFSSKIKDMLIHYDMMVNNEKIKIDPKIVIGNFYETADDFIIYPNTKLFLSTMELNNWLTSLKTSSSEYNTLIERVDISKSLSVVPYIYKHPNNNIYLIQNTKNYSPDKALTINKLWIEKQINYGLDVVVKSNNYPHFVYGISSDGQLEAITDNTNDSDEYLEILYYGSQLEYNNNKKATYAALLRLV